MKFRDSVHSAPASTQRTLKHKKKIYKQDPAFVSNAGLVYVSIRSTPFVVGMNQISVRGRLFVCLFAREGKKILLIPKRPTKGRVTFGACRTHTHRMEPTHNFFCFLWFVCRNKKVSHIAGERERAIWVYLHSEVQKHVGDKCVCGSAFGGKKNGYALKKHPNFFFL